MHQLCQSLRPEKDEPKCSRITAFQAITIFYFSATHVLLSNPVVFFRPQVRSGSDFSDRSQGVQIVWFCNPSTFFSHLRPGYQIVYRFREGNRCGQAFSFILNSRAKTRPPSGTSSGIFRQGIWSIIFYWKEKRKTCILQCFGNRQITR